MKLKSIGRKEFKDDETFREIIDFLTKSERFFAISIHNGEFKFHRMQMSHEEMIYAAELLKQRIFEGDI